MHKTLSNALFIFHIYMCVVYVRAKRIFHIFPLPLTRNYIVHWYGLFNQYIYV